eukprot:m.170336 g.170336  ORF g.170336 m.170336 type:complete len:681 (-) comp31608_c2_seq4:2271-4313(-)
MEPLDEVDGDGGSIYHQAKAIFEHLDSDDTGFILSSQLESVLPMLESLGDSESDEVSSLLDSLLDSEDGQISLDEFVRLVVLIDTQIPVEEDYHHDERLQQGQEPEYIDVFGDNARQALTDDTVLPENTYNDARDLNLEDVQHESTTTSSQHSKKGISRSRGRSNKSVSSIKLKHLKTMFDQASTTTSNGQGGRIGSTELNHLLHESLAGNHKGKKKARQYSMRQGGRIAKGVLAQLAPPSEDGDGGDGDIYQSLTFDQFSENFGELIDDDGNMVAIPKLVSAQLDVLQDDARKLVQLLDAEYAKNDSLQQQLETQSTDWQTMLDDSNQEAANIEAELQKSQREIQHLRKEARDFSAERSRQAQEIERLEVSLSEAETTQTSKIQVAQQGDTTVLRDEVKHLQQENDELQQSYEQLLQQVETDKETSTHEAFDMAAMDALRHTLEAQDTAREELIAEVVELRDNNRILMDECEELKLTQAPLAGPTQQQQAGNDDDLRRVYLQIDTDKVQDQIRKLREATRGLRSDAERGLGRDIETLEGLDATFEEVDADYFMEQLTNFVKECEMHREKSEKTEAELDSLRNHDEQTQTNLLSTLDERDRFRRERDECVTELHVLKAQVSQLEEEKAKSDAEIKATTTTSVSLATTPPPPTTTITTSSTTTMTNTTTTTTTTMARKRLL